VKVERERQECDELLSRSTADRTNLDDNVRRLEYDNEALNRQIEVLHAQLTHAQLEHNNE